ncbi:MAG: aspartate/glutamate racemase family protein [Microgenomates group bacterium]|jgi:aspartate racemase
MKILEDIIRNIIAGKSIREDKRKLIKITESLQNRGAEGIILGCTELPLIFPKRFNIPVFDSLNILANALLKFNYEKKRGGKTSYFGRKLLN